MQILNTIFISLASAQTLPKNCDSAIFEPGISDLFQVGICDGVADCDNQLDEKNCYEYSKWTDWTLQSPVAVGRKKI